MKKIHIFIAVGISTFWITNLLVASLMFYNTITLSTILYFFPICFKANVLLVSLLAPLFAFAIYRRVVLNHKNFRDGVEYGSAVAGRLKDIEPFIEKKTYWLNKMPVSKSKYDEFCSDKGTQKSLYLASKSKLSFTEWKKKYAYIEKNEKGTRNNLLLSEDVKLGYFQANRKNKNVILIGGSGTGKTRFVIKPNLMQLNGSYVVTDPKGTILNELGYLFEKAGYQIKILNTIDFNKSMKYNPFSYIFCEQDINILVNVFMSNTSDPNKKGGDQFWDDSMKMLLVALIGYLWKHCLPEEQNFSTVLKLINLMNVDEDEEKHVVDYLFDDIQEKYELEKETNPSAVMPYELSSYLGFKKGAGDTMKSILISCTSKLQVFAMNAISNLMQTDEIQFEKRDDNGKLVSCLGDTKQILFCIISDSDSTYNFIVGMLYSQLFNRLLTIADNEYGGKFPIPVMCFLDEFANIGLIPEFEKKIATIRSRNVSATIVLQSKSQLKALYKDNAETIIGNCDSEIFLGGKELSTLKEVNETVGKETIDLSNISKTYAQSNSNSINYNKTGKSLVEINDLKTMKDDECVVQVRGLNPFLFVKKYNIENHPMYKYHANDIDSKYWFSPEKYLKKIKKKKKSISEIAEKSQKLLHEKEIDDFVEGTKMKTISFEVDDKDI